MTARVRKGRAMQAFTAKTDEELAVLGQRGDPEAESALVARYWDLAGILANTFRVAGVDYEDRLAVCLEGLLKSARRWEPGKGTTFKTLAKRNMRNALIDLHRTIHKAGEIPPAALRSMDAEFGDDGGTLGDTIAGGSDTAAEALAREDAAATRDALAFRQWEAFCDALDGSREEVHERLALSVRSFARTALAPDDYADLCALLDAREGNLLTLMMGPAGVDDLARRVFESYASLQWLILADLAEGRDYGEIADGLTERLRFAHPGIRVRAELVGEVVRALRAQAGVADEDADALPGAIREAA